MKARHASLALLVVLFFSMIPAHAEILIGFAGPMTGPRAWSGQQFERGAEQAVAEINAAGGVLGERLKLVVGDDASDPQQAKAVARKLVADGVVLVVGHRSSDMTGSAAPIYDAAGVIQITPSSTNPELTERGYRRFFRVCGRDDVQAILASDYLAESWAGKRIGIIHDNSSYGSGLASLTRDRLDARGIKITLFDEFQPGKMDYGDLLDEIRRLRIEVLYIGGYSAESALIVRQARDAKLDFQLVSGDALHNSDFWLIADEAGIDSMFTFDIDPRTRPEAQPLVARFRADGYEPEGYTLHTYAAIQVWAAAARKAGTLEPDRLAEVMHASEFDTVLGKIAFDRKGDLVRHSYAWYRWQRGAPVRQ